MAAEKSISLNKKNLLTFLQKRIHSPRIVFIFRNSIVFEFIENADINIKNKF
jgi:hypothetical protein